MNKIFGLVVVLFSFFSLSAHADEGRGFDLQVGGISFHGTPRSDGKAWNERNNGVAVQYTAPGTLWGIGVEYCLTGGKIKNSEFGQTLFAGGCVRKTVFEGSLGKISVGLFAGGMTYPSVYNNMRKTGDVFLVVLPTASACMKNGICLDSMIIPKVQGKTASAAVLFMGRFPLHHW